MVQTIKHYILLYEVGDGFIEGRARYRNDHLKLARSTHQRGELLMAGALANPPDGAVLIFRSDSPQAAESFAKSDPYVTSGLVKSWRVREWSTVDWPTLPED